MNLAEGTLTSIVYTSESNHESKTRSIVPVSVPRDNVRAIDVSALPKDEQELMATLVTGYKEYLAGIYTGTFKFEDWVEHTTGTEVSPMWRTFKVSNIKVNEQ